MGIRTKLDSIGTSTNEEYADLSEWRYTTETNGVRTLQEYLGQDKDIVVPSGHTQINHPRRFNEHPSNSPFYNRSSIYNVDINFVPFVEDYGYFAFSNSKNFLSFAVRR